MSVQVACKSCLLRIYLLSAVRPPLSRTLKKLWQCPCWLRYNFLLFFFPAPWLLFGGKLGQLFCSLLFICLRPARSNFWCPAGLKRGRLALNVRSFMHPRPAFTWDLWVAIVPVPFASNKPFYIRGPFKVATPSKLIRWPGFGRIGARSLAEPVAERCDMIVDRLQYKPDCSSRWHIKHRSTQVVNQLAAARKHLLP